jgi:hypothetical protein
LIAYPNLSQSPYAGEFIIGKPLNIVRVLHLIGVDPQTGLYAFADLNHDGQITYNYNGQSDDSHSLDLSPKYDGGFTNTITYKHFQISIFFYFKKQLGRNILASLDVPGDNTNQPVAALKRWQKPGDIASTARFTTNPTDISWQYYQQHSDAIYSDASFIRLQNLYFSYQVPDELLRKMSIRNIKFYIQGNNLFLITHYNGLDPEVQNFSSIPLPRIVTTGLSCNF